MALTHKDRSRSAARLLLLCTLACALVSTASAEWKEKVLYSFQGGANDGASPAGGVVFDKAGNLYGATDQGGGECPPAQCGIVFQLAPPAKKGGPWAEAVLYVFKGNASGDGNTPVGSVIIDNSGNLYGTTGYGGTGNCVLLGTKVGCGTVYELSPPKQKGGAWMETVLYSFPTSKQGYLPNGDLVFDSAGNLYGATMFGGGHGTTCNAFYQYCGAVFELSPPKQKGGKWTEGVLHGFSGISDGQQTGDGANPNGALVVGSKGDVYGTTYIGGDNCPHNSGHGCGSVFKLGRPTMKGGAWTETMLHRFQISRNEANPAAGMTFDGKGYLYGTTGGTIFQLARPSTRSGRWKETILSTFNNYEAYDPAGALIFDTYGNLYGTAQYAKASSGAVFRLEAPNAKNGKWTFTILYGFAGSPDGAIPAANLIFDKDGNLYSTTTEGGTGTCSFYGCGTVFEVSP